MNKVRIDIVSDVVCPWCIIGYKRLQKALDSLADEVTAEIHWHPFELNPNMPEQGQNVREHLAEKYGTTTEDSIRARASMTQIGQDLGFDFDYFDGMKMYNTFKAHQLLHYAREQGKETELKLRLFSAFFGERKAVGEIEVLVKEAEAVGLDPIESRVVLEDERYAAIVRQEQNTWLSQGVHSVPTFVFNGKRGIAGAHEPETLARVIRESLLQVS